MKRDIYYTWTQAGHPVSVVQSQATSCSKAACSSSANMGQACHIVNHESWGQNPQYIYTFIYFLWVSLVHLQQSHLSSNANAPRMLIKYQQPFRIIAGVVRICTITPQVWLVAHYIPSIQFFPPRQIHDQKIKKFLSLHHHHQPRPQSSIRKWQKHKTYTELQLAQKFVSTVSDAKKCWERERERESYSGMTLTSACDAAWIPSRNESNSASRSPLIRWGTRIHAA